MDTAAPVTAGDVAIAEVVTRLRELEAHVRAAVARRRATDPEPDDPYRGLYLSDAQVDRLLDGELTTEPWRPPPLASANGDSTLARLATTFGLDDRDVDILLVALAVDVDARFERLYGYLHDDLTRRRASAGLALELTGGSPLRATDRARFAPSAPLVAGGLIELDHDDRPLLSRALRVPERVVQHVLGSTRPPDALLRLLNPTSASARRDDPLSSGLGRVLRDEASHVYLRVSSSPEHALEVGAAALAQGGYGALCADLTRADRDDDLVATVRLLVREARLAGVGLVLGPLDVLSENGAERAVRELLSVEWPIVVFGTTAWDPRWSSSVPLVVTLGRPAFDERRERWRSTLHDVDPDVATAAAATGFRLGPGQIERAARAARLEAVRAGAPLTTEHIATGVRSQNSAGLERLARRIEPRVGWADLVLPPLALTLLHELEARARHRGEIEARWGLGGGLEGRGVTALFSGPPGTGKTMAAEVIAHSLGLDLFVVDLATVVDKYIGETEKNLDRVFKEAEAVNGILFFDEADALFGKRSEVSDARDRYANLEIAYLLQRMETFGGLAVLATNLGANLDEAFLRRLDAVVEFPMPDELARRRLWELALGTRLPRGPDVDLHFCAKAFELSGGHVRNVGLTAAFFARDDGGVLTMAHLIRATQREYRKLGRLCLESEFGPYFDLTLAPPSVEGAP